MRGLNLLRRKSALVDERAWERHQQLQIDCSFPEHKGLRAVFPGSMLFNQILVPDSLLVEGSFDVIAESDGLTANGLTANGLTENCLVPDTIDIEFEFCGHANSSLLAPNTLLVDVSQQTESFAIDAVISFLDGAESFEHVVFLGAAIPQSFDSLSSRLPVKSINPDWMSAYTIHALYRAARHVLVMDSMRILDAAFTECSCSLIVGERLQEDMACELLIGLLEQTDCKVIDSSLDAMQSREANRAAAGSFRVVQNKLLHVQALLSPTTVPLDWLEREVLSNQSPVIDVNRKPDNGIWSSVLDRRTRFARKAHKLIEDPAAFLADSNHPVLKTMTKVFRSRRKAG